MTCIGGDRDGLVCSDNSNCPDGMCRGFCLGGVLEGDRCLADFGCEADFTSGACFFSGGDPTGFCEGGDRDGESCFSDSDCKGTTCDCLPGCADPLCCTDVCTSLDPFCCDVCWDETCTLEAQTICRVDCNDNGISDDEDISAGTSPDVNLNSIPDECENGSCCFEDGNCRITKGMNCTSEVWTLHGTCIPYPCPPVGGACCDNSLGLGGVCTDNVFFEDCRGRHLWWTINTKCSEITCKEVTGACCDRYYGVCQDDVQQQHCTGKLLNWKEGKNCQNSKCIRACCYRRLHNCDESLNLPDCDDVTRDARTR